MFTPNNHFLHFQKLPQNYSLPKRFTYPFNYEPHSLCIIAAEELQTYLENQTELDHNFDQDGKMFGVLVVQNNAGTLGYLAAFSGKLANSNHHHNFVPPVFDTFIEGNFFRIGESELDQLNAKIQLFEESIEFQKAKVNLEELSNEAQSAIVRYKAKLKSAKIERGKRRENAKAQLATVDFEVFNRKLHQERLKLQYGLKRLANYYNQKVSKVQRLLDDLTFPIEQLKRERRTKSADLQEQLFKRYQFLNGLGEQKSLKDIFENSSPPAGAGECAAPKLLQYAFLHQLKPIAIAEFWWGASPKSEVRKHKYFYPACKSKCEPILTHMLRGIEVDPNPIQAHKMSAKKITAIYEDEYLLVIHKPHDFLSVPGKLIKDSVQARIQQQYPASTGPLIVHRLDMSTSGLMLIAKAKDIHKDLQTQFAKRLVKKRYVALLDGLVEEEKGTIDLPLRVDLEDRPRQLVCYGHGKSARTHWKVIDRSNNTTRIHFFPVTGRTHQLRVHSAHHLGLNRPIVGDELYGSKANRLYLHAEWLAFQHPINDKLVEFEFEASF